MPLDEVDQSAVRVKSSRRLLAVILAAILLMATFIGILLTTPISEMVVIVRNWETETVSISMRLDGSEHATSFYIDGGQSMDWLLHVSPGTHTVGLQFTYDHHHNETIDFLWTAHVGFNGFAPVFLEVNRSGLTQNHHYDHLTSDSTPVGEALKDPNILVPGALLAAWTVILVAAIWNYRWRSPK